MAEATSCAGTYLDVYKSDEELFAESMTACGLVDHPRFAQLSACVSSLLAVGIDDLSAMRHEDVLVVVKQLGFVFEAHDDVRHVVEALTAFTERSEAHERELRAEPFRCFDVLFFRDRHGQLMATFSMGPKTKVRLALTESWERKFALGYQYALQAYEQGEGHGLYDAEDGDREDG